MGRTLLPTAVDRAASGSTCTWWRVCLSKAKNGEGWLAGLFFCRRSQSMGKKCFLQCSVLVKIPRKNLIPETDSESESMCEMREVMCLQNGAVKSWITGIYCHLISCESSLGLQRLKHLLFLSSLRCHNFSSQTPF